MIREDDGTNPFPDGTEVWVRYPADVIEAKGDREDWPWLAGLVIERCGTDEWHVQVTVREVATTEDGSPAPVTTPDDELFYPLAFRDASEIRRQDQQ